MKKPEAASSAGMPSLALPQECVTLCSFPHLSELLCNPNWDDTSPKGQRTVMLFVDDRATRILVKLEADCLKFSVPATSIDEALSAAELLLRTGKVVWEQDRPQGGGSAKKKK